MTIFAICTLWETPGQFWVTLLRLPYATKSIRTISVYKNKNKNKNKFISEQIKK